MRRKQSCISQQGLLGSDKADGFKPQEGTFRLDIKRKIRMVRPWYRVPRAAPSLEVSKARSDKAWSDLVLSKMILPIAGG